MKRMYVRYIKLGGTAEQLRSLLGEKMFGFFVLQQLFSGSERTNRKVRKYCKRKGGINK